MESRRHKDYGSISASSKLRNQHRHDGADSFHMSRHEVADLSPNVQRRSLSPNNKNDGSRRISPKDGRSGSTDRRGYSWHLGQGRTENVRSGSPPFVPEHRKPHFDEGFVNRKFEQTDDVVYGDGQSSRLKHAYVYDHHPTSSGMMKDKKFAENRILDIDEGVMMRQKSMPIEDVIVRGSHRVPLDYIPASNYEKTGSKNLLLPSQRMNMVQYGNEKMRNREPLSPENLPVNEFYREDEKSLIRSRDDSYNMKPTHLKGYGAIHFKDFAGTSSGISKSEFFSSCREEMPISIADEYPRNSRKLTEPMDFNTFGQRSFADTRDIEAGNRGLTRYPHGAYSPNRSGHDDYIYPKSQGFGIDNNDYPSEQFCRTMPSVSQLDHEQALSDYEYREMTRMSKMHPTMEKVDHSSEDYFSGMRNSSIWDDHNIHEQKCVENLESSRILYAPKHGGEYFDSEYTRLEFGRRISRDCGSSNLKKDQQISHLKSDYGFGRDAGPQFQIERSQDPYMSVYGLDMPKISSKRHRMEDELATYEQSDKVAKIMYGMEGSMNRRDPRTVIMSNKNYTSQEYEDECDSEEKWIDEELNNLRPSRNQRFDHTEYRKAKRTSDGQVHRGNFVSEDWCIQESFGHSRKNQVRYYKPGVKYTKSHLKSGSTNWYNSNQNGKRSGIHRNNQTWKKNDEYGGNEEANGGNPMEDWENVTDSEPSEESEEFKQLVHEAFLDFSKKLNLSSALRRRYREQGKAGSLFCIVCGRSASKDFMDTQRLVTHVYMSHKVGLRAQHMGLHKAICVLMGWNTYVPSDTKTWVPDVLPDSEAWAQKEDLMLWPPLIIIHNISMSNNNPEKQQVIPIEGVEAFLRGKGFAGGKMKVCLGKPADQSVILVKFLGTFTGLGQAERLNKYFLENKRGREEFKQKTSISSSNFEGVESEKIEEILLYGYMGVADDLEKIDFNTKKWITVKSKKDIQDLADAPVKTENR